MAARQERVTLGNAERANLIEMYARRIAGVESDADSVKVVAGLKRDLEANPDLIEQLLGHRTLGVREWTVGTVVALLGRDAGPLLLDVYRRDADPDVRSDALRRLIELDPRLADPLKPRLRKQLRSTADFYEPEDAMWALLELGDSEAEPEIQAIAANRSDGLGLIAEIVAQALRGEEQIIAERLLRHDHHYLTKWLARGAALLSTPEMLRALAVAVESLPDAECRESCAYWLGRQRTT